MSALEITVMGCGSSGGVPRIDSDWGDCDPAEPKNRRTRCSLLVRRRSDTGETCVIVDTSPDLRAHCLSAQVRHVDGVVITHDHADQCHGIDDLRAFAIRRQRRTPVWMDDVAADSLTTRFGYIFEGQGGYPAICDLKRVAAGDAWRIDGDGGSIPVSTFEQDHGEVPSLGVRFGDVAYSPDVLRLPESAFEALRDLDLWIVDALRWTPHPTHSHVQQTLDWIARVKPRRAVLTNLHIDLDYNALSAVLPEGVAAAYDGLKLESPLSH